MYFTGSCTCVNHQSRETARTFSISMHVEIGKHAKPHVHSQYLCMRKLESTRIHTYILNIYACGNWKARETARTFSISMHAEIGRHAKPHVHSQYLCMRKLEITRNRTYILNIYACGNWKSRETACRFSPTIYTKGFKPAKPHVRFPSWMAKQSNNSAN